MFDFSKLVRKVFLEHRGNIDLPSFHRFPKNSCESASYFLGAFLAQRFPDKEFLVVHGYKHSSDESHYWVEVEGKVIDITADQFSNISQPIYGADKHPLSTKFPPDSKVEAIKGINRFDLVTQNQKEIAYNQISQLIQLYI